MDEAEAERQKRMDERFARDKEELKEHDEKIDKLTELSTQMGEILKNQQTALANHDRRIAEIETKPARRWDIIVNAVLQWLVVAFLGAIMYFKK